MENLAVKTVLDRRFRLGIIATHPVQYLVPWYRGLANAANVDLTVYYASLAGAEEAVDPGFGVQYSWDVPMLDGYRWQLLDNQSKIPAVHTFRGTSTPSIYDIIRSDNFDGFIIPGWGRRCYMQTAKACVRHDVPFIIRGEARSNPDDSTFRKHLKQIVVTYFLRRCACVLSIGRTNESFYRECNIDDERIFHANYFIDNPFFSECAARFRSRRTELRRALRIGEDEFVFLFAGKFIPKKRPLDVLKATELLVQQASAEKFTVLFVGDGQLKSECEAYARSRSLPVVFQGFRNQSDMPQVYAISDCLLLPSDQFETWGLVVNEAMACGLPAIISDRVGCGPDLVVDGVTGFIYPLADIHALAYRMNVFICNNGESTAMGRQASRRVADYNVDNAVAGTLDALQWVSQRRRRRD